MKYIFIVLVVGLFVIAGCNDSSIKTLEIGPETVDCEGVGPMKCLVVNDQFFYGHIKGFDYEEGYNYTIKVKIEDVKNPPADGSSKKYTLVEIISKE